MKYSIIICPKSDKSIAIRQAYQFIEAILKDSSIEQPHKIDVFFYGLAVKYAFESNDWQQIANQGVKLTVCSTIAETYQSEKMHPCFSMVGIGQWIKGTIDADKSLEFI